MQFKALLRATLTMLAIFATSAALAQAEAPVSVAGGLTLSEFYKAGGPLMHVLAAISVFFIANVIYLFATLRSGVTIPRAVFNDVLDKVRGGRFDEARKICDYKPGAFTNVAMAAIDYATTVPEADPVMLNAAIEGEGARQATRLQGRTQWLLDIAAIAPMVGLLGTVIGMLHAFHAVSDTIASAKPVILAQGVSMALITTIAGLFIAIPAMAFYAWFRRMASRQVAHLECACSDLLTAILTQRVK
ncbi:MAG: MotA/TolQ/ExbB proton channel family protein [Kiritimatiellia bacterium]|jgi:biopolymer transport protein ExbB